MSFYMHGRSLWCIFVCICTYLCLHSMLCRSLVRCVGLSCVEQVFVADTRRSHALLLGRDVATVIFNLFYSYVITRALAQTHSFEANGFRRFEIQLWVIYTNSLCLSLSLSLSRSRSLSLLRARARTLSSSLARIPYALRRA